MITFVVREELETLWMRICGLQASLEELAYLYAFLAVAGKTSFLSQEEHRSTNTDLKTGIKDPKSCHRHAAIAEHLLQISLERQRRLPPRLNKYSRDRTASSNPLKVIGYLPYDWRDISRCPYVLLRCYTLTLLLTFYWMSFEQGKVSRCCHQLVEAARVFNLFELVRVASQEAISLDLLGLYNEREWNEPSIRYVGGLRRLHYEVVLYTQHSIFPQMLPLLLTADESVVDEDYFRYGTKDFSIPEKLSAINKMRMTKASTISFAVKRLLEVESMYFGDVSGNSPEEEPAKGEREARQSASLPISPTRPNAFVTTQSSEGDASSTSSRIEAFLTLDNEVHGVLKERWGQFEQMIEPPSWRTDPIFSATDSLISLSLLHHKLLYNRIRFELMSRLVGSSAYSPAIQAIAMWHALDTLSLLSKM
jgi:hypothetical protein